MGKIHKMVGEEIVESSETEESIESIKNIHIDEDQKKDLEYALSRARQSEVRKDERTGTVSKIWSTPDKRTFGKKSKMMKKSFGYGDYYEPGKIDDESLAYDAIKNNRALFGIQESDDLRILDKTEDRAGGHHVRFKQHYKDVPIQGSGLISVHIDSEGLIYGMDSSFQPNIDLDVHTRIPKDDALKGVKAHAQDLNIAKPVGSPERVILILDNIPHLAWKVKAIGNQQEPGLKELYLDAHTGKLLKHKNRVYHSESHKARGISYWENNQEVNLDVENEDGIYKMKYIQDDRPMIETRARANNAPVFFLERDSTLVEGTEKNGIVFDYTRNCPEAAVDCHRYSVEVLDYFKKHHQFDLCEHVGGKMVIVSNGILGGMRAELHECQCDYSQSECECGYPRIDFVQVEEIDDESLHNERWWCSLEVIAHEWTHSLLRDIMEGDDPETGALREAICDAFGAFVSGKWKFAEVYVNSNSIGCERNLEDPNNGSTFDKDEPDEMFKKKCGPDNYQDFVTQGCIQQDYLNCCIIDKATHLMAKGGMWKGVDYGNGMGVELLENLYFHVLTNHYLKDEETFLSFKDNLIRAVDDRYVRMQTQQLSMSQLDALKSIITKAFAAVGIC